VTRYLTLEDLLYVASEELGAPQVRDHGLLESALARPAATLFGADAYATLHTKAAALLSGWPDGARHTELWTFPLLGFRCRWS
jgi:hypothetical protein